MALQKAEQYLREMEAHFKDIAAEKRQARLCLCPAKACPFSRGDKHFKQGLLHCPGYTMVEQDSAEHRFLFESMEVQRSVVQSPAVRRILSETAMATRGAQDADTGGAMAAAP